MILTWSRVLEHLHSTPESFVIHLSLWIPWESVALWVYSQTLHHDWPLPCTSTHGMSFWPWSQRSAPINWGEVASPWASGDNIQTYFLRDAKSNSFDDKPGVIRMPFPLDFLVSLLSSSFDWGHWRSNHQVCTELHLKQNQKASSLHALSFQCQRLWRFSSWSQIKCDYLCPVTTARSSDTTVNQQRKSHQTMCHC